MNETILLKLCQYCAYQDRCTSEVEQKLSDLDVPPTEQLNYLAYLEAERFLDDRRYAGSFVRGKHYHKGWGRIKIRHHLQQKGLSGSLIETALREEIAAADYQATLQKLTRSKWQQWEEEPLLTRKDKTSRFLAQRGYTWEEIMRALQEVAE
jgi:regulatory protein